MTEEAKAKANTTPRLCIDCQWIKLGGIIRASECTHPALRQAVNVVDGSIPPTYCEVARSSEYKCGHEGKLFGLSLKGAERQARSGHSETNS